MGSFRSKLSFIGLVSVTLLAFQNCADSKFASLPSTSVNNAVSTDVPDPAPDLGDDVDENDGSMDPDKERDAEYKCKEFKDKYRKNSKYGDNHSKNTRGDRIFDGDDVTIDNHRGRADVPDALAIDVNNTRGRLYARTCSGREVKDTRGSVCIVDNPDKKTPGSADGSVKAIRDHRGRLEVEGLNVDSISNTRGPIVLRDVHVKSISNHRGSIRLINSVVDSIVDHRGPISYK